MKRRDFINKTSVAAGALLLPWATKANHFTLDNAFPAKFTGVRIGAITYSFRSMPSTADDLLGYLTKAGLNACELMGGPIEEYAGAPKAPPFKRDLTDAEKKERETYSQEMKKWRTMTKMDKIKELRKKYNDQNVEIDVVKFPLDRMSPEEMDFCFNVAKTMGAKGITLERSDDAMKLLGPVADKNKLMIGYHNHTEVSATSWDAGLAAHKYNAMNLDVGHYVAGTNESPIPLIQKYNDRILNIHMKDRKKNNGDNMPWGQGDTPLRDILQLMKKEKYPFMATIELEYNIPEGSDAVKEVKKCVDFCKEAIA